MNASQARQYALAQAYKIEPVATPFWPQIDGQVYLQDIPADELGALQQTLADKPMLMMGAVLCRSLMLKDPTQPSDVSPEPMFQPTDRDAVAHQGSTVLLPLMLKTSEFFGLGDQVASLIKNA